MKLITRDKLISSKAQQTKMFGVIIIIALIMIILIRYHQTNLRHVTSTYFATNRHLVPTDAPSFDPNKDWMIFFHIQKTSGSSWDLNYMIGSLMVREKRTEGAWHDACYEQYGIPVIDENTGRIVRHKGDFCRRPANSSESWYLSSHEKDFEWSCGLHPYLSDLKKCVRKRLEHRKPNYISSNEFNSQFHFVTLLRDPISRFYSEFKQTRLSGTLWIHERPAFTNGHQCANDYHKQCTPNESGQWQDVKLEDYMSCENNLAFNRQTRMLAGYDDEESNGLTLCEVLNDTSYGMSRKYDEELFARAISNLHSLSFFGLAERQIDSKKLFVKMFNKTLRFRDLNRQDRVPLSRRLIDGLGLEYAVSSLDPQIVRRILDLNHLDARLYEYAYELFESRLEYYGVV